MRHVLRSGLAAFWWHFFFVVEDLKMLRDVKVGKVETLRGFGSAKIVDRRPTLFTLSKALRVTATAALTGVLDHGSRWQAEA